MLALFVLTVAGAGAPTVEVHAHGDAAFGHSHEVHGHGHYLPGSQPADDGHAGDSADAGVLHAHADGCVSVGLTSSIDVEIPIPAWGRGYIPRPASRPPDKPVPPLYRPPIA